MTIAILHLSDIHFKDDAFNPITHRVEAIVAAITPYLLECKIIIPILSGDIAYSGNTHQYKLATPWLADIRNGLRRLRGGRVTLIDTIATPGNHDCNFSMDDDSLEIRAELLRKPTPNVAEAVVKLCCRIQNDYSDFAKATHISTSVYPLHACHEYPTPEGPILVHTFNSAWMSSLPEREGNIVLPNSVSETIVAEITKRNSARAALLSIWTMHHPLNWFQSDSAKRLRATIERTADIVITGHEHEGAHYSRTNHITSSHVDHIEGCALQESSDAAKSAFNLILLDTQQRQYQVVQFAFDVGGNVYTNVNEHAPTPAIPFQRNLSRLDGAFDYTDEALAELQNPGANFTHPRRAIRITDIYVAPDVREIPLEPPTENRPDETPPNLLAYAFQKERVVFIGADKSGKSATARYIALEAKRRDPKKVPLLLNGSDVQLRDVDHLPDLLRRRITFFYGRAHYDLYWKLAPGDRVLIVDDFHLIKVRPEVRSKLIARLQDIAQTIIIFVSDDQRVDYLSLGGTDDHPIVDYAHAEILPLGHLKRHAIVTAWYALGRDMNDEATRVAVVRDVRQAERVISELISTDLVPSYPIIVLVWLQNMEAGRPIDTSAGSYGYLYYSLILDRLRDLGDQGDRSIDGRLTYLKALAWHMYFSLGQDYIESDALETWHEQYRKEKLLAGYSYPTYVDGFVRVGLVRRSIDTDRVDFCYPFLFNYFVARALADKIVEPEIREHIRTLARELHNEQAANITNPAGKWFTFFRPQVT